MSWRCNNCESVHSDAERRCHVCGAIREAELGFEPWDRQPIERKPGGGDFDEQNITKNIRSTEKKPRLFNALVAVGFLVVVTAIIVALSVVGKSASPYKYKLLSDNTVEISAYKGNETTLDIPSTINGHIVSSIGEGAFRDLKTLSKVTIPNSVKNIGSAAFYGCEALTDVTLPSHITRLNFAVFAGTSLANIIIPDSVTIVDDFALYCCSLAEITIPCNVTRIGEAAFAGNFYLSRVILPEGLSEIGSQAFSTCPRLKNITIPDSVASIADNSFEGCNSVVIECNERSYAWDYATRNDIKHILKGAVKGLTCVDISVNGEQILAYAVDLGELEGFEWNKVRFYTDKAISEIPYKTHAYPTMLCGYINNCYGIKISKITFKEPKKGTPYSEQWRMYVRLRNGDWTYGDEDYRKTIYVTRETEMQVLLSSPTSFDAFDFGPAKEISGAWAGGGFSCSAYVLYFATREDAEIYIDSLHLKD